MTGVAGIGVDVVHVPRIRAILAGPGGEGFIRKTFTEREMALANRLDAPETYFAARFAAKEAVFKSLGTGWCEGESLCDIEVLPNPDGVPTAVLAGRLRSLAKDRGFAGIAVSMSSDGDYAIAVASPKCCLGSAPALQEDVDAGEHNPTAPV